MEPQDTRLCVWAGLFDEGEKLTVRDAYIVIGFWSLIPSFCINWVLRKTDLYKDRSYRNVAHFTLASAGLRLFQLLISVVSRLQLLDYLPLLPDQVDTIVCDGFGFIETFLTILEVELLTHVCIERYVVAKYNINGWELPDKHYSLFVRLSCLFAGVYSLVPVVGIGGRYSWDFTCDSCVYDMVLPSNWQSVVVLIVFFLRSVKPVGFMIVMIYWCRQLEKKYEGSKKQLKEVNFTKKVVEITLMNLIFWSPLALVRGYILLSQVQAGFAQLPVIFIQWALWLHYSSAFATAVTFMFIDDRICMEIKKLIFRMKAKTKIN